MTSFRRELLRVLNRGESVNALKRATYTGRSVAAAASRPSSSDASPRLEPRASTCVGIFRFPVERYVDKILPSVAAEKTTAGSA